MQASEANGQAPQPERRAWFERAPIDLGELAVETVAVVFGILLALSINSWYEGRKDQALVDSALQSLRAEVARNREVVLAHQRHLDGMAAAMTRENPAGDPPRPCMAWKGWAGFEQPMLLDTAYEVAIVTQALAKMPFAQASRVGEVYGAQRYMQTMHDKAGGMLIAERPTALGTCIGVAREAALGSGRLVQHYDVLLQAP